MANVKLDWTGLSGQEFKVEYKKTSDVTWIVFSASQTAQTATITGLDFYTSYDFRVTAICGTSPSTPVSITQLTQCPLISGLTSGVIDNDITLNWTNGYSGQTVKIEYKLTTDITWTVAIDNLNATTYTISDLEYGASYDIRVIGKCGTLEINTLTTSASIPCPPITNLTALNV